MKRFSSNCKKLSRQILKQAVFFTGVNAAAVFAHATTASPITISGISSGAFMAVQMGTIYSSQINGVGSVAGGFFYCSQNHLQEKIQDGRANPFVGTRNLFDFQPSPKLVGNLITGQAFSKPNEWLTPSPTNPIYQAVGVCMGNPTEATLPDLKTFEKKGLIEATSNIGSQKIYIYQGDSDTVVNPQMAQRLEEFYKTQGVAKDALKMKTLDGGHNFPTDKTGLNDCKNQSVPYVSSCQFDLASDMLTHLLGRNLVRSKIDTKNLYRVDQNLDPVNEAKPRSRWKSPAASLAAYGYLYASPACLAKPETCQLHVALHGCEMSDSFDSELDQRYSQQVQTTQVLAMRTKADVQLFSFGSFPVNEDRQLRYGTLKFALQSGYAELAEQNNLMILFPQTWITPDNYPYNPKGCWDWFGANNSDYATNKGIETSWLIQYAQKIKTEPRKYILSTAPDFDKASAKTP